MSKEIAAGTGYSSTGQAWSHAENNICFGGPHCHDIFLLPPLVELHGKLFKNGPGEDAITRKDGSRLIIELLNAFSML